MITIVFDLSESYGPVFYKFSLFSDDSVHKTNASWARFLALAPKPQSRQLRILSHRKECSNGVELALLALCHASLALCPIGRWRDERQRWGKAWLFGCCSVPYDTSFARATLDPGWPRIRRKWKGNVFSLPFLLLSSTQSGVNSSQIRLCFITF